MGVVDPGPQEGRGLTRLVDVCWILSGQGDKAGDILANETVRQKHV